MTISSERLEDDAMAFFSTNVDAWGAAEWFDRLARAIRAQDRAVVAGDMVGFETYRSIAASSAMRLVRDYEDQVRAAILAYLSASEKEGAEAKPVAWHWWAAGRGCTWPVWSLGPDLPANAPGAIPLFAHPPVKEPTDD